MKTNSPKLPPISNTCSVMFPLLAIFLVLLGFLLSLLHVFLGFSNHKNGHKLPPGPQALPIIGNLHMLGSLPHQTLDHLAKKYGDIMSIRLGFVQTIIVSSPQAAELFLKTHDTIFASRPKVQASHYMAYGAKAMAFTEYGPYWRHVRKLCTLKLFSQSKIESFAPMRREELGLAVESLIKAAAAKEVVDFNVKVDNLIQNMTCRMLFGRIYEDELNLVPLIREALFLSGAFNLSDYVPFLAPLDLQGLTRRMKASGEAMDKVLEMIIDDHEQAAHCGQTKQMDFVDILLSLINQPVNSNDDQLIINRTNIKAILIDMVVAGFDSSAATLDWTFAELLKHPRVMKCLQQELENVVGLNRMVEETDLPKLTYLDMVIKETLRLHPIAPLLVPHESTESVTFNNGYHIPKKSRVIINAWAIGRDTNAWSANANEFFPERFKDTNLELRGQDFQLIPFGSGRRGCPGLQLGLTTIRLVIAQLVHCFNWELPNGMLPSELDMTEKFGLALERVDHLLALPTYRLRT